MSCANAFRRPRWTPCGRPRADFGHRSGAALHVLNRSDPLPADARAALLNLGSRRRTGRYVAFLDYDDLIYPEGWRC